MAQRFRAFVAIAVLALTGAVLTGCGKATQEAAGPAEAESAASLELHHGPPATVARGEDSGAPIPEQVSFNRHVRPILSDNCFACHGPDKANRKANLSLHTFEEATRDLGNGRRAIVAGDPDASEILKRIVHEDPRERMPPIALGKTISPRNVEILRRWIASGAQYEQHWAYLPPQRQTPPAAPAALAARVENPIDAFVFAKLAESGLEPAPEADKRTLIRRVSLDLTGIPPTPQEVDAFIADKRPDAYERLVDRLLASPHYGERMALHWLDAVRYADTWGFHGDADRSMWPYRDYVIRSFNADKPFDQFTIEQLAGDLMGAETNERITATAFNLMNKQTSEGGAQAGEYLAKYMMDRVSTVGTVWLGQTMGCAECHDHKYDPIAAKDVYSMQAFFADISERGKWGDVWHGYESEIEYPIRYVGTGAQKTELERLRARLLALREQSPVYRKLNEDLRYYDFAMKDDPRFLRGFESWLRAREAEAKSGVQPFRPAQIVAASAERHPAVRAEKGALIVDNASAGRELGVVRVTAEGDLGRSIRGLNLTIGPVTGPRENNNLALDMLTATVRMPDGATHTARLSHHMTEGQRLPPDFTIYRIMREKRPQYLFWFFANLGSHKDLAGDDVLYVLDRALPWAPGAKLDLELRTDWPEGVPSEVLSAVPSFTLSVTDRDDTGGDLRKVLEIAAKPAAERTDDDRTYLEAYYRAFAPQNVAAFRVMQEAEVAFMEYAESVPSVWAVQRVEPRQIRVLPRGDWQNQNGDVVAPAVPAYLGSLNTNGRRATRLDLARWLVSDDNPLTARTVVNRYWAQFFGAGIARTLNDLGSQGEWPTHPELLDWLALEYRDDWRTKPLVRLIVTSATYKQSSVASAAAAERDPQNRLLSRQNPVRLPAEIIRDNALAIAGVLNADVGGPSFKPYQPEGYYTVLNFPRRVWRASEGDELFRRGIYMHWQRSRLHPFLKAFDAPPREESVVQRANSNTPLQALALLNDPVFIEIYEVFGETLLRRAGDDDARLRYAFERALARAPEPEELERLRQALVESRAYFTTDAAARDEMLRLGERALPRDLDAVELAAWTYVARIVLNLHETMTRT